MTFDFKNLKSDLSNISKTIRFVYDSDKRLCYFRLVLIIVQSILPLISLYLLKELIDTITNSGTSGSDDVWFTISLVCGVFLFTQISAVINTIVGEILGQRIIDFINSLLHNKSLELDLTYYDNPEYHDTFHRAQQEATFRPIQILNNISELIKNLISFVGVAVILASVSGYVLLIMVIAGIPALFIKLTRTKIYYEWRKANTSLYRKVNYCSMLMTHRI
ncbi:MAG: ABC transporter ATP-binding protein [Ignavibacteria bacterium]|nr:ABC transporter ATP-binding protein [Ignavibacteria bacterium]